MIHQSALLMKMNLAQSASATCKRPRRIIRASWVGSHLPQQEANQQTGLDKEEAAAISTEEEEPWKEGCIAMQLKVLKLKVKK